MRKPARRSAAVTRRYAAELGANDALNCAFESQCPYSGEEGSLCVSTSASSVGLFAYWSVRASRIGVSAGARPMSVSAARGTAATMSPGAAYAAAAQHTVRAAQRSAGNPRVFTGGNLQVNRVLCPDPSVPTVRKRTDPFLE